MPTRGAWPSLQRVREGRMRLERGQNFKFVPPGQLGQMSQAACRQWQLPVHGPDPRNQCN